LVLAILEVNQGKKIAVRRKEFSQDHQPRH
jgi:hypothetical protein